MRSLAAVITAIAVAPLAAQDMEAVMRRVELNNTTLRALADGAAAEKAEARAAVSLPDPEVEYARLWGTPAAIGNRTDVAVTQGFDIATISGMKLRQARRLGDLADAGLATERAAILLEAREYCIELIHCNRMARALAERLRHAELLVESYRRKLDAGEANILELNRVRMDLESVRAEVSRGEIERDGYRIELRRMSGGGSDVELRDTLYPAALSALAATGYGEGPQVGQALVQSEVALGELRLARAAALPSFSVGYMRERTAGQYYQGVKAGVSIPLWAGRGRVRAARATHRAAEAMARDAVVQAADKVSRLRERTTGLAALAADCRRTLAEYGSGELQKRALDAGEISLAEYLAEISLRYGAQTRALEAERDSALALAALAALASADM